MTLHHGDCLEVMAQMEPESVDAIVTDPPYGLEFMGKEWDTIRPTHGNWNDAKWAGKGLTQKQGSAVGGRPSGVGSLTGATPSLSSSINRRCLECGKWQSGGSPCKCESPRWEARADYRAQGMQAWHQQWAEAAYRVAKPSAYLLAFGGTRTVHRLTCAIEDAGWIIRDMLVWGYASGFPKSKASLKPAWEPIVMARKPGPLRDLAIDLCRIPGGERPLIESKSEPSLNAYGDGLNGSRNAGTTNAARWPANIVLTDPIFDGGWEGVVGGGAAAAGGNINGRPVTGYGGHWADSREFDGYGDSGTYSRFFQIPRGDTCDWCGAASVTASSSPDDPRAGSAPSRAATEASSDSAIKTGRPTTSGTGSASSSSGSGTTTRTRSWPGSPPDELNLSDDPANNAARLGTSSAIIPITASLRLCSSCADDAMPSSTGGPESAASPRWFLIPKADRADREPVLGGLPRPVDARMGLAHGGPGEPGKGSKEGYEYHPKPRANVHPTVKPTDLMRHLVRLVTPAGGVVLDPFLGSGTTALAAEMEGFEWIGIEKEAEYCAIAEARLNGVQKGLGLSA